MPPDKPLIVYPDSDGLPIADDTLQFDWITMIEGNLEGLFRENHDVFVAGDLLWYPVEGDNTIRTAPDAMVAFGRPKGHRGSYKQWEEGGLAPQVVFEVLSPLNRAGDIIRKFRFYERYGVEEFYFYDPYDPALWGWQRVGYGLDEIADISDWKSPRLGIRFDLTGEKLRILAPDGRPFLTYVELVTEIERINQARTRAERPLEQIRRDAREQAALAERLAAKLRELGIDPDA
jgi:Uma2 family endonuclease